MLDELLKGQGFYLFVRNKLKNQVGAAKNLCAEITIARFNVGG